MKTSELILGVLLTIALSVVGWLSVRVIDQGQQLTALQTRFDESVDVKQNETLVKFWKLHNWTKDQILELRLKNGLESSQWPDL